MRPLIRLSKFDSCNHVLSELTSGLRIVEFTLKCTIKLCNLVEILTNIFLTPSTALFQVLHSFSIERNGNCIRTKHSGALKSFSLPFLRTPSSDHSIGRSTHLLAQLNWMKRRKVSFPMLLVTPNVALPPTPFSSISDIESTNWEVHRANDTPWTIPTESSSSTRGLASEHSQVYVTESIPISQSARPVLSLTATPPTLHLLALVTWSPYLDVCSRILLSP